MMNTPLSSSGPSFDPRQAKYVEFMKFIQAHNNRDRLIVSRKLFSFVLWCFIAPALVSVLIIVLSNSGVIPKSSRAYLDGVMLVFPVLYSLYFVGVQLLSGVPKVYREGGFAQSLGQALTEYSWRVSVLKEFKPTPAWSKTDWSWVIQNLEIDIHRLETRAKYLTGLAGSVFFLIMQGIDALTMDAQSFALADSGPAQWVGLALFLTLFYISSLHTPQNLQRYLSAARLMRDFE